MDFAKSGADAIQILWRIPEWYPDLGESKLKLLSEYHKQLMSASKVISSLIPVKSIPQADNVHFADSIVAVRHICLDCKAPIIHDLGSGNGFPGLVGAIIESDRRFVLVESDKAKVDFLKSLMGHLELKNVEIQFGNIESLAESTIEAAMTRGFSQVTKTLLITRKCLKKDSPIYHIKGEEWASEVASIPTQLCSFWNPSLLTEYKLPVGEVKYGLVKTIKIA